MKHPGDLGSHKVSEPLGFHGKPGCKFRTTRAHKVQRSDHTEAVQDHRVGAPQDIRQGATEVSGAEG